MKARDKTAWDAAVQIVRILRDTGHTALLAGGCVRDTLLSVPPKDYDVATDARPRRVLELFPKARKVGAQFGVVLVRKYGFDVEVATFRSEGPYSDGRHPDKVTFGTAIEDARRRDFTINGLFYDPIADRIIDHVQGRADIDGRIIRTIGDPDERFAEDHLRMLRAVRFAARFNFTIEPNTAEAVKRLAPRLRAISAERIWQELELILTPSTRLGGWNLLVETGLVDHLVEGWRCDATAAATIGRRLAHVPDKPISGVLALATVWLDEPPQRAATLARRLRLSNRQVDGLVWLIRCSPVVREETSLGLVDLKILMAAPHWPDLLTLLEADERAASGSTETVERVARRASAIPPDQVAPPPLLTGTDLQAMGVRPGPRLGEILDAVYRAQLEEQITKRDQAEQLARRLIESA